MRASSAPGVVLVALALAATTLVPEHYREVATRRIAHVDKTLAAVHERIAADLDAFHKAGGKIEVLGVTRSLKKIDGDDGSPPPAPAKPRR